MQMPNIKKGSRALTIFSMSLVLLSGRVYARQYTDNELHKMGIYFLSQSDSALTCAAVNGTPVNGAKTGTGVYILGDSVTAAAEAKYNSAFGDKGLPIVIDSSTARTITTSGTDSNRTSGIEAVTADKDSIASANSIVIALGTSGGNTPENIQTLLNAIRAPGFNPNAKIFWVDTTVVGRPDYVPTIRDANRAIYNAGSSGVTAISWFKAVTPLGDPQNPTGKEVDANGLLNVADPHYQPTSAGIDALVTLVVAAVTGDQGSVSGGCYGSGGTLTGGDNLEKAFKFFIGVGLSPLQAAGILGSMVHEAPGISGTKDSPLTPNPPEPQQLQGNFSSFVPSNTLTDAQIHDTKLGWGIVQWTPSNKMIEPSRAAGITDAQISTLEYQLHFLWEQLNGNGTGAAANEKSAGDALKAATTIEQAALAFAMKFERCTECSSATSATVTARIKSAIDILAKYGSVGI
jgi:hypothetical protein